MKRLSLFMASTLMLGCSDLIPVSQQAGVTMVLTPRIMQGGYGTQATVSVYTISSIDHLVMDLYAAGTKITSKTITKTSLNNPITLNNLRPNTAYRIKSYAYLANETLISLDDSSSWLDFTTGTDDRPNILTFPVHLSDVTFNGQATGTIQISPGGYSPLGAELLGIPVGGYVTTVAGTKSSLGTADGTGVFAKFNEPYSITVDNNGYLYVADYYNNAIRKIELSTGVVSTIAGTKGSSGSIDGTGTEAQFYLPFGIAYDGTGNLYIADYYNHAIRKLVLSSGAVTTIAGTKGASGSVDGIGTAAKLFGPAAFAFDGNGTLYFSEYSNHTIRKMVLATGEITTFAGTKGASGTSDGFGTLAQFRNPKGLQLDGNGNLYVADSFNYAVRKIVLATGEVTTVAGGIGLAGSLDGCGTSARFNKPMDIALDNLGNLYVADRDSYAIRKIVLTTGAVTTLTGTLGTSGTLDGMPEFAQFKGPAALALDSLGNLYVGDRTGHAIRRVQ